MKQKQRLAASECIWKIAYLKRGYRYEDIIDHRSYTHNLSSCEYYSLKKLIQAWTGFESLSNLFYQLSYQAIWELVTLWVCNIPVSGKDTSEYMKDHIWLVTLMVQKQLAQKYKLSSKENKTKTFSPQKRQLWYKPLHMLRKAFWLHH